MRTSRRRFPLWGQAVLVAVLAFAATFAAAATGTLPVAGSFVSDALPGVSLHSVGCYLGIAGDIKGNVSHNTGERIYHVPGQHYYEDTVISPTRGERWFCSEADARAAGWRKAGY
jgi:hypothetical protein